MERRNLLAGAMGALLPWLSGCLSDVALLGEEERTESRTYDVEEGTELRVNNRNGSITVEAHGGDVVEVDVALQGPSDEALEAVSVAATETDGELRLETEHDRIDADQVSVRLTIRCPAGVPVGRLETTNGSIEATDVAGDPVLESTNGALTARNVDGTVSLSTSSGAITARSIGALAGATTSNGSITVDVPALEGDADVETTNGSIDAALAPTLDAAVSATTINGTVELEDLELSAAETSESRVSGTLGDGTHALSLETTNGSIDLRALSE